MCPQSEVNVFLYLTFCTNIITAYTGQLSMKHCLLLSSNICVFKLENHEIDIFSCLQLLVRFCLFFPYCNLHNIETRLLSHATYLPCCVNILREISVIFDPLLLTPKAKNPRDIHDRNIIKGNSIPQTYI